MIDISDYYLELKGIWLNLGMTKDQILAELRRQREEMYDGERADI